jgi:hypothetical protein
LEKGWQRQEAAQQCREAARYHLYLKMAEVLWKNLGIIKKKRKEKAN